MPAFDHGIEICAPAAALFALTQDYARRLAWDPFLKEACLTDGATAAAVGVRAWCVARSGLGMETEYVTLTPPRVAAVRMTCGPRFLASFAGSWRFEAIGPNRTQVRFRYHFMARPRWLRWLLHPLLMAVFSRDTVGRLKALKRAAEKMDSLIQPEKSSQ